MKASKVRGGSSFAVSMLGLAIVRKSLDPQWNRFACIFPGDKPTEWFISEAEAQAAADKFNSVKK